MRSLVGWVALALLTASCAARQQPQPPMEAADAARRAGPAFSVLQAAAAAPAEPNPLHVRETGLDGLTLGMAPEAVTRLLGAPTRTEQAPEGAWWHYPARPEAGPDRAGSLDLLFAGEKPRLVQARAWAPSRMETRTMVRPLDPASRLVRKYGETARVLPWGPGEAWIYPAADVAYVLTPAGEEGDRRVAGVIVGLGRTAN